MRQVSNSAVSLQLNLAVPRLKTIVQVIEMLLSLGNQPVKAGNRLTFNLAVEVVGELALLTIDKGVEADVNVPSDHVKLLVSLGHNFLEPTPEAVFKEHTLSSVTIV